MTRNEARELCRSAFLETLQSLQVEPRLRQALRRRGRFLEIERDSYPLSAFREICVVSFGKAAAEMAAAVAEILSGIELRGVVAAPVPAKRSVPEFQYFHGGHPHPNEGSRQAAGAVLQLLQNRTAGDVVLFLISGGGSALLEKPLHPSVSFEDMRRFHELLVSCGAAIEEINTLRKHFSAVKGGRLAERASPATQITLYVSDVPDSMPSAIASGPTMPDASTVEDCRRIARRYNLLEKFPASIRAPFDAGTIEETPKPGDACFAKSRYHCLLSNRDGVRKLLTLLRAQGIVAEPRASASGGDLESPVPYGRGSDLPTTIIAEQNSRCDEWDFRRAADHLLATLNTLRQQHSDRPVALVSGGELSCPVTGNGTGGRNQAFALYCVPKIAGQPIVVLSGGTDGIDGNSPACGAIADGSSAERAAAAGLNAEEFLGRSDSYHFFDALGDTLIPGPTGTNVRDLRILLAYS